MRTWLAIAAIVIAACTAPSPPEPGILTVLQESQPTWIRNFNPFLATGSRWPTKAGVYEPLMIFNGQTGEWTPWLAERYAWDDATHLRFTVRRGVQWSDGQPFTARDVATTFELMREHPGLDLSGVWKRVATITVEGDDIIFAFHRPYAPALAHLAHQPIVPAHIWGAVPDPLLFANENPVGTGPFTEVTVFRTQVFQLEANPHYWQPGKPAVRGLRFPAVASNDQATLALLAGKVDWAGNFIPAADRIFVGRDPEHHHYWFPPTGAMIFLYPNHQRPPLDDARVRMALSLGLDRQVLVDIALHGYAPTPDPTGLSDLYRSWRDPQAGQTAASWVTHDPDKAGALLDAAGWKRGADGQRRNAAGDALRVELMTVSGWSDWVRAAQVASQQLSELGIECQLRTYDFSAWFDQLGKGQFDLSIGWSPEGPTPHSLYEGLMAERSVKPVGTLAPTNWHRRGDPRMDALLDRFEQTPDRQGQQQLVAQMQQLFAEDAPAIPLFPSPSWGEYNSTRFTGFPDADNPYARLSPNHHPDPLLVMTRVRPVEPTP